MLLSQQREQLALAGSRVACKRCATRPLLPRRHRIPPCQYAILGTGDIVSSELVKGLMLSAVTTSAIKKASSSLARGAAVDAFVSRCCIQFNVSDKDELQDLLAALILSECVYKKMEMSPAQLTKKISDFMAEFPRELVHIEAVQLSLVDVTQNYLVAVGGRSVYVAFMGTKQARDVQTDLAFSHEAVWAAEEISGRASEVPSAHRGFLARAKSVPINQLQALAEGSGRRLVLCGHSLGGAVAKLAGLKLLRESPEWLPPPLLRVICFATPAVGNNALASLVETAGWGQFFKTYVLPEDQLMRMLQFTVAAPAAAAAVAAAGVASGSSSSRGSTDEVSLSKPGTAAAAGDESAAVAASSSSNGILDSAAAVANGVAAVAGLFKRPFVRESAKEQLRKELRAEEASTPSLDGGLLDLSEATTAAAATPVQPAAAAASSSSRRPFNLPSRLFNRQQQQQQLSEAAALAEQNPTQQDTQAAAAIAESAAAAAGESGSIDQAAAAAAPSALSNLGYVMQLQGNWVAYQLAQMGRVAMAPLTTAKQAASIFHPFGQYEYITYDGVQALHKTQLPDPNGQLSPEAAAFQEANPGLFSFHRMVAYRTRCFQIINKIAAELAQQGLLLPSTAAAAGSSGGVGLSLAAPREWQIVHPVVRLGTVLPQMRVQSVLARPPLRSTSLLLPPADDALLPQAPPAAAAAASSTADAVIGQPRRGALAFLPGGRGAKPPEPTIQLICKVQGSNLHLCRKVGVLVFGEQYQPTFLMTSSNSGHGLLLPNAAAVAAAGSWSIGSSSNEESARQQQNSGATGSSSSMFAPLIMLRPMFDRVKQAAVAAAKAYEGDRPRWRTPTDTKEQLTMQILLPVSVVDRLLAAAAAASGGSSTSRKQQQQQQQQGSGLILQLKSDFELLSVPVQLKHHVVGVVGSSSRAAALVQSLLARSGDLQQQYKRQVAAAAAAASSNSSTASGLQRWLPQPQKWIAAQRQQQQQSQQQQQLLPVDKVKAAANLAAAGAASVAAARLAMISRQVLGRRIPGDPSRQSPDLEPPTKRMRTAAAASSSMGSVSGSLSSFEEPPAAAQQTRTTVLPPTVISAGSSMASPAAAAAATAPSDRSVYRNREQQQQLLLPHTHATIINADAATKPGLTTSAMPSSSSSSSSSSSRLGLGSSKPDGASAAVAFAADSVNLSSSSSSSSSSRKGGLSGVKYHTLPLKPSPLLFPLPPAAAAASLNSDGHSLYQVLRRASRQLRRQQQQQGLGRSGFFSSATDYVGSVISKAGTVTAASATSTAAALRSWVPTSSSSSGSQAAVGAVQAGPDSQAGSHTAAAAASRSPARKGSFSNMLVAARQQRQQQQQPLAADHEITSQQQQQQQQQLLPQQWDALLLPVTFDLDFIQLMKCRSALSALAAAAAAAGVQIVPLLLLEGEESVMTVSTADIQAAGLHHHSQPVLSHHDKISHPQGLLRLDDAAAQLAAAMHLPAAAVHTLRIGGLLCPSVAGSSGSSSTGSRSKDLLLPRGSSNSSGMGSVTRDESSTADILGAVGGLASQRELLQGLQHLEGRLAGLLQAKHNEAVGLLNSKL